MKKKKRRSGLKIGAIIFAFLFIGALWTVWNYYKKIYFEAVQLDGETEYFFIYSDWSFDDLVKQLYRQDIISDTASFIWVAQQKHFEHPKPGKYFLEDGMSNNALVNLLRSGNQTPVKVTFNAVRTRADLAGRVASQLELDSISLLNALTSKSYANRYGFNRQTFLTMFLPNTYELYWDTSTDEFIKRMAKEYKRFWNEERMGKARALNLSQSEVSILASIVQAEQMEHRDERAKIAGLYINRLRRKMPLQSDPTLIYALGDFSIKRVLNQHKRIKSDYNTYINKGLPPGPINLADLSSIDAVLNYEKHSYLYMCAKADFSGYHNFSKSLRQHNVYANQFRQELNRRRILK